MEMSSSKWRRFREEFGRWADRKSERGLLTSDLQGAGSCLPPNERSEFKRFLSHDSSRNVIFDWADSAQEIRDTHRPLFDEGQLLAGRFQILRSLGRGGMGEVYEATDNTFEGSRVAIKTLNAELREHPDATRRFIREVELAQRVTHPNICRIHDIFPFSFADSDGKEVRGHFLTMQLLEGESLTNYLRDHGPLQLEEAVPILRAIAEALNAAHSENVLHRDLKPGNIILVRRAEGLQPIITDFGLAALGNRAQEADAERTLASYTCAGTPEYSASEQFREGQSSPASDIYSLGVVALEMLTGRTVPTGVSALPGMARKASRAALTTIHPLDLLAPPSLSPL